MIMRLIFRPSFSSASFPLFLFSFGYSGFFFFFFFWLSSQLPLRNNPITRGYHYTYIRCYIPLHCVTSGQQSCFSDFRPMRSVYLPFLACRLSQYLTRFQPKTLLWIVQMHAFALYIDLETFTLLPG